MSDRIVTIAESHTILWHVERSAAEYLKLSRPDWLPEAQIYRGAENRDTEENEGQESSLKVRPCAVLTCQTASPQKYPWNGLWETATLMVCVEVNRARFTGDDADRMASEVFDLFLTPQIKQSLNGMIDGFTFQLLDVGDITRRAEGRGWAFELEFKVKQASRKPLKNS